MPTNGFHQQALNITLMNFTLDVENKIPTKKVIRDQALIHSPCGPRHRNPENVSDCTVKMKMNYTSEVNETKATETKLEGSRQIVTNPNVAFCCESSQWWKKFMSRKNHLRTWAIFRGKQGGRTHLAPSDWSPSRHVSLCVPRCQSIITRFENHSLGHKVLA